MNNSIDDDIDVIETDKPEYVPEIGDRDYLIVESENMEDAYDSFSLESGDYEMDALEADRTIRSLSNRANMALAEDGGAVFFSDERFCYVNVNDIDYDEGTVDLSVRKGDIEGSHETSLENQDDDISSGFFEKVIDEVETSGSELDRQRKRMT